MAVDSGAKGGDPSEADFGLTALRGLAVDRFVIRLRGSSRMVSAWRLSVSCAEGHGAIIFVEASPEETFYRGEGVFLGWPQERLREAYRVLRPGRPEEALESNQPG